MNIFCNNCQAYVVPKIEYVISDDSADPADKICPLCEEPLNFLMEIHVQEYPVQDK